MLLKFIRFLALGKDYTKCPKCGSDEIDKQNNIWHCYRCGHEW